MHIGVLVQGKIVLKTHSVIGLGGISINGESPLRYMKP